MTEWDLMRYTVELQACPHLGLKEADPIQGTSFYGGYHYEENLSAQEASAQAGPRLPDPHEHQERPQGHRCPPCKGPQEPDCLILHQLWAQGAAQEMMRKKTADIELGGLILLHGAGRLRGGQGKCCRFLQRSAAKVEKMYSVRGCHLSRLTEISLKELAKKTPERTFKVR